MKNLVLILIHIACAAILVTAACSAGPVKSKLRGDWTAKDGKSTLKISDKQFTVNSDSPVAEDYFVKGDTIYTSFEGNQPYSKFVIKQLDEHQLKLQYPDSTLVEFAR